MQKGGRGGVDILLRFQEAIVNDFPCNIAHFHPPKKLPHSDPFGIPKAQDTFDHDKGQKSAISGRRLRWRLSTGFFAFLQVLCVI